MFSLEQTFYFISTKIDMSSSVVLDLNSCRLLELAIYLKILLHQNVACLRSIPLTVKSGWGRPSNTVPTLP
jgi:hypothetical protein